FHKIPRNSTAVSSKSPAISNISNYFLWRFPWNFYTKIFFFAGSIQPPKEFATKTSTPPPVYA
ncbi:MAG: hypothetical protein ACXW3Z_11035, partial [Limisphaerales bacterium]